LPSPTRRARNGFSDPFLRVAPEPGAYNTITSDKNKQTVQDSEFGVLRPELKANFTVRPFFLSHGELC